MFLLLLAVLLRHYQKIKNKKTFIGVSVAIRLAKHRAAIVRAMNFKFFMKIVIVALLPLATGIVCAFVCATAAGITATCLKNSCRAYKKSPFRREPRF